MELQAPAHDVGRIIGIIDEALDYANDKFEGHDLREAQERVERMAARRAQLDEIVKSFARPGIVPWRVPADAADASPPARDDDPDETG
jgi:hypothetical protein